MPLTIICLLTDNDDDGDEDGRRNIDKQGEDGG